MICGCAQGKKLLLLPCALVQLSNGITSYTRLYAYCHLPSACSDRCPLCAGRGNSCVVQREGNFYFLWVRKRTHRSTRAGRGRTTRCLQRSSAASCSWLADTRFSGDTPEYQRSIKPCRTFKRPLLAGLAADRSQSYVVLAAVDGIPSPPNEQSAEFCYSRVAAVGFGEVP